MFELGQYTHYQPIRVYFIPYEWYCFLSHLKGYYRLFPALLRHAMCTPCDGWINELCSAVLSTEWQSDKDISCGPPATDPTSLIIRVLYVVFCRQLRIQKKPPWAELEEPSAYDKMKKWQEDQWTAFGIRERFQGCLGTVDWSSWV